MPSTHTYGASPSASTSTAAPSTASATPPAAALSATSRSSRSTLSSTPRLTNSRCVRSLRCWRLSHSPRAASFSAMSSMSLPWAATAEARTSGRPTFSASSVAWASRSFSAASTSLDAAPVTYARSTKMHGLRVLASTRSLATALASRRPSASFTPSTRTLPCSTYDSSARLLRRLVGRTARQLPASSPAMKSVSASAKPGSPSPLSHAARAASGMSERWAALRSSRKRTSCTVSPSGESPSSARRKRW
mmetsp:Transcript_19197/g.65079  ORF Transcript_19197/g.65079 Transcript_19197/m.65079 type:complete len:249 (-) Transcript_19197:702-1448(-)